MDDLESAIFNPSITEFMDFKDPIDKLTFMGQYLSSKFIRVGGLYYRLMSSRIPDPMWTPLTPAKFMKYLKDFDAGWEEHISEIKSYFRIVCAPSSKSYEYNLLSSLNYTMHKHPLTADEHELIVPFIEHFCDVWCDGSSKAISHMINLFACKLEHPFESVDRTEQYTMMLGAQGVGKTEAMKRFWEKAFGKDLVLSVKMDRLTAKFNAQLMNKLILLIDDGGRNMTERMAEKIKNFATDREIVIEGKYRDSITAQNIAMIFMSCNKDDNIKLDCDDRRCFALEASTRYKGEKDHFFKLYECIDNHYKLIIRWILSNATYDGRVPQPPQTRTKLRLAFADRDELELALAKESEEWDPTIKIRLQVVFTMYKQWVFENYGSDAKPKYKQRDVAKFLSEYCIKLAGGGYDNGKYKFTSASSFDRFRARVGGFSEDDKSEDGEEWQEVPLSETKVEVPDEPVVIPGKIKAKFKPKPKPEIQAESA